MKNKLMQKARLSAAMALACVFSQAGQAGAVVAPVEVKAQSGVISERDVPRNAAGVRLLDLTKQAHFNLVKSRLSRGNIGAEQYPWLHRALDEQSVQHTPESDSTGQQAQIRQSDIAGLSHAIWAMNVAVDKADNQAYLVVKAINPAGGKGEQIYFDLMLTDEDGKLLAPVESRLQFDPSENNALIAKVSLTQLKSRHPQLDMVYASSWAAVQAGDGTVTSALKLGQYPFSWQHIEEQYADIGGNKKQLKAPEKLFEQNNRAISSYNFTQQYNSLAPVDSNGDDVIKVCLTSADADCDYAADSPPGYLADVHIPFKGQMIVPHEITSIYASDLAPGQMPSGIDEQTGIYLQQGSYNGALNQSYKTLDNQEKTFSDYLVFDVDPVNKQTIISWDIPRDEGRFGNALWFSNTAETNWHFTFAVQGFPYFNHGRGGSPRNFLFGIGSETSGAYFNYYVPTLPKMQLGYRCDAFMPSQDSQIMSQQAQLQASQTPVYINGVRYQLTKADFVPIYRQRIVDEQCGVANVLSGYQVTLPVQGDTGQELIFDINGRSDGKVMNLTASCGDFHATDSGDKYVITKTMVTNRSCTNMALTFEFDDINPPAMMDINLQISETF
ncbi:hypothetical protein [Thalassomonas actiniarum]|uniref:Uncharacterized protein n=1 Tax=Thalassomonas actiniarum TaxID=485447 RepID=A0AAE9YM50_9GAMM|nr:hypothetical protein [Thalassomonas actiniarum]WDD97864.1 hypothetical protein SG35_021595 [Thalassomonas actiniarum]